MNAKRQKYATTTATLTTGVKEEVVPVLIHDPNNGEPQYAYATFATADEAEAAVASLGGRRAAHEVIIDEHGRAMTLQELVQDENTTVEEVEAVEEADGTHTILHIQGEPLSPNSQSAEGDGDGEDTSFESTSGGAGGEARHNNKTFYCPNCGNCYSAAGSLKLHMRACLREKVEVPAELRKCEVCQKVFNSVTYLKEHMLRHTGEGPRKCVRCYRKFVNEDKLKAHMETHALQDKLDAEAAALAAATGSKKVTVKEFTCSFCSKSFTVVFESGHVKRRYACDDCREKFSNQELLKQHKQEIEDKREFHCERCGRKFVFEGFLQRHLPTCDGTIKRRRDMK